MAWGDHSDAGSCPLPGTAKRAESETVDDAGNTPGGRKRDNAEMEIEQLEQIAAVIVTAGLVAGNFLMFTPWRNGVDPRQQHPKSGMHQNESRKRSVIKTNREPIEVTKMTRQTRP